MFNLKQIISSIADAGQKLFSIKNIKKNDLESIISLCDDLISHKGAAFGITVARDITELYQSLSPENKLLFFQKINEGFLNMIKDLGEKPTPKHQIDRIDEDKDYSPENCVWSTHKDNQWRRSKNTNYPNRVKPDKHVINPGDKFGGYTVIKELETVRRRYFLCTTPKGIKKQVRIDRLLNNKKNDQ